MKVYSIHKMHCRRFAEADRNGPYQQAIFSIERSRHLDGNQIGKLSRDIFHSIVYGAEAVT